jgi:hypothetical protein
MQLRDRFIEDMRLAGCSTRAQEAFVHAVARLVRWVGKPPMRITEEGVRQRFLYLTHVHKVARGAPWALQTPQLPRDRWPICEVGTMHPVHRLPPRRGPP